MSETSEQCGSSDPVAAESALAGASCVVFIPTLTSGGAERVASVLANKWVGYERVSVTVILLFSESLFYPVDSLVTLRCLGMKVKEDWVRRLGSLVTSLWRFRRIVREIDPKFVLTFMNKYNVYCLAALLGAGQKVVAAERDSPTEPGLWWRWVLRVLLYPSAAGLITQSELSRTALRRWTRHRNIGVIPNPVEPIAAGHVSSRERIVLNVARLVRKKGHEDLLRAFAAIEDSEWRLVLCGEGPLRGQLEELAARLGIVDRVHFAGTVRDIGGWYARAGIFAFTSYFEGFPNALAEAMVAGLPVVSYDCPTGPSDLIRDGRNGILVPLGDIQSFSAALQRLMKEPALAARMGSEAMAVATRLDVDAVAKEYYQFCAAAATSGMAG